MFFNRLSQWLSFKESSCNAGDVAGVTGSIPESRRSSGEGNGIPLQYSCLGNPVDRGAYSGVAKRVRQKVVTKQQQQIYLFDFYLR